MLRFKLNETFNYNNQTVTNITFLYLWKTSMLLSLFYKMQQYFSL